jgi:hypothetical protein
MGQDKNKIVLSDFVSGATFQTMLPSPFLYPNGTYADSVVVLVTVSDVAGSIANQTMRIPITSVMA